MKTIITTVGTSLLTNYFNSEENTDSIKTHYETLKDKPCSKWNEYLKRIEKLKEKIEDWIEKTSNASAEIKSIEKFKEELKEDIKVILIATDTILSVLVAKILIEYFSKEGIFCEFEEEKDVIKNLQVKDAIRFEKEGIVNLVERLDQIINSNYSENIVFNITGGYKATIPYMTIMAQVNNIPIYYIFENTDKLIKIPQAPMDFDFSIIEENYIAFNRLRKKKIENLPTIEDFKKDLGIDKKNASKVFEELVKKSIIEEVNGKIRLSILGELLFRRYKQLFESGNYHKQNLISNLIELKLFKYFIKKFGNEANVEHEKKLGERNFDIDIYIEKDNEIIAIEVKSGGNVPLWNNINGRESIERKLTEGGFKYLLDRYGDGEKKLRLEVFLYSPKSIHPRVIEQIKELHKKYLQETQLLKWYWIKIDNKYSTNTHWDINEANIKEIKEVKNV